ncbi:MAG: thioredoxin family protein [Planctomycetaceae bacterium]|nr:thioredoxin family protein [Planctomycetaceae bacterium]
MVKTASTMLPIGTKAPAFALTNVDGNQVSNAQFAGKPLLVVFMCNHCPFVVHLRSALADFGKEYQAKGLAMVGISSNDVGAYPQDGPDKMKEEAAAAGYTFPYLFDADQSVAKAYRAACTPDFFLFDADHSLVYRGQFDSSRPGNGKPVTGADLRAAVDAVLAGGEVASEQLPSIGCNIKWKAGSEPEYFTGVAAE